MFRTNLITIKLLNWNTIRQVVFQFLSGQIALQIINVTTGLLLLRWLSIDDQAKYSFAFSLQASLSVLADLGFGGSILALVGSNINNKAIIGDYLSSAKYYRNRLFSGSIIIGLISLPFITQKQHWDWLVQLNILLPVVLVMYLQGAISLYSAPLQMHRKVNSLYGAQLGLGLARLLFCLLLYYVDVLNAYTVLWLYNAVLLATVFFYKRAGESYYDRTRSPTLTSRQDMFSYIKPLVPSLIFNAFFGQITVFLITFFGKQQDIAQLGALSRFGQLFTLLTAFNTFVIAPYIAACDRQRLPAVYAITVAFSIAIAITITTAVWIYPASFLNLLGTKYTNLTTELHFFVLNLSLNYVGAVLWTLHASRKWIFGFNTWLYISGLILIQAYIIVQFDLSTTYNVVISSLLTTCFVMLIHIETGIIGWLKFKKSIL